MVASRESSGLSACPLIPDVKRGEPHDWLRDAICPQTLQAADRRGGHNHEDGPCFAHGCAKPASTRLTPVRGATTASDAGGGATLTNPRRGGSSSARKRQRSARAERELRRGREGHGRAAGRVTDRFDAADALRAHPREGATVERVRERPTTRNRVAAGISAQRCNQLHRSWCRFTRRNPRVSQTRQPHGSCPRVRRKAPRRATRPDSSNL